MKFVLKGNIIYATEKKKIITRKKSYVVCEDGICKGVFKELPIEYKQFKIIDYKDALIMPGFIDLHLHAPQYAFIGTKMDLELIEWLNNIAFKEESRYKSLKYAKRAYENFTHSLKNSVTTRACIFATRHVLSSIELMSQLEKSKLITYVGKVNMDQNGLEIIDEKNAEQSIEDTLLWLKKVNTFENTKPILTPRFIPSCSVDLLNGLKNIQSKFNLPVQSHLSENKKEINWVKELFPTSSFYGKVYDNFNLFGYNHQKHKTFKTIMAHCVHSSEKEIDLLKKNKVFVAHCPTSNINLNSGIAPIKKYLKLGLNVGLGSDVAAGNNLSMFEVIKCAIQVSKYYKHFIDANVESLSFEEAFYLATLGGGKFFNKVGTFKKGYEFDAVVINDKKLGLNNNISIRKRIERAIYLNLDNFALIDKYVRGEQINLYD